MGQLPQLGDRTPEEVDPGSPGLVLSAVGQLMSQHSQVSLATIRQEYTIAQRQRPITARLEHETPKPSGRATASGAV
jgi:hypothetical protein